MRVSSDEARALGFVALLLTLAGAARALDRSPPILPAAEAIDLAALEHASREALAAERRRREPIAPGERIDPNAASADEIARLPGIGRVTAQRVVEDRQANGPFATADDLARVQGIGTATVRRIAPYLALPGGRAGAAAATTMAGSADAIPRTPTAAPRAPAAIPAGPIDLNRATPEQLRALPGIGPVIAARIVAFRDSVGGFRSVDELVRVSGVGPATLARLRPHLVANP